jgi:hypothetical protein
MYQDYGVDLKDITAAVQCPDCLKKFAVRLSIDYIVKHQGEPLSVICLSCAKSRIAEIKKGKVY